MVTLVKTMIHLGTLAIALILSGVLVAAAPASTRLATIRVMTSGAWVATSAAHLTARIRPGTNSAPRSLRLAPAHSCISRRVLMSYPGIPRVRINTRPGCEWMAPSRRAWLPRNSIGRYAGPAAQCERYWPQVAG